MAFALTLWQKIGACLKKKQIVLSGLPVSFLDALGLALAAMLLLMFTNLSALQSKTPPPERYYLLAKICFSEVDISTTLWNVRWLYGTETILATHLKSEQKMITFGKKPPFMEKNLLFKPANIESKKRDSLLRFGGIAELRESENQSILCYSLDLAFPLEEEPSLEIEVQRAGALPTNKVKDAKRDKNKSECWKYATLEEEKSETGVLLSRVYPFPQGIDVTVYTTGAKSEHSFRTLRWEMPAEGAKCEKKKIRYNIRLVDSKLELKEVE